MNKSMKKLMLLWLMLGISVCVSAQTITGTVISATDDSALPGVSVSVKGTTSGTTTDENGNFSITIQSNKAVLEFTYIGFKTQAVTVTNTSKAIKVALVEDAQLLNEVVVTAYGTVKKANLTTAQVGVTSKQLNETVNTTIEQAIQGRAAGVYVTQDSGQPGGAISVTIRGVSSITGSTEPLYVIDGVQIQGNSASSTGGGNPLAGLNPTDIADMQILQGPSAAALYGSRATNGVVLITTKRGKAGDVKIDYSYQLTEQGPPKELPMMNLQQYAAFMNTYAGGSVPAQFADPSLLGAGTDWQKVLFRTVPMYQNTLSVSGGTDKLNYYLSGEYMNQTGVAVGSGFSRYGVRLNVDNKANKWLTIGLNFNYNQTNENLSLGSGAQNSAYIINSALQMTPQVPVSNFDGTYGGSDLVNGAGQWAPVNPIAIAQLITNNNVQRKLLGGGNIQINILPGLFFKTEANTNLGFTNGTVFSPTYNIDQWHIQNVNSLTSTANLNTWWMLNELLQYSHNFGKHYLEVMASHEASLSTWRSLSGSRTGFPVQNIMDLNMGSTDVPLNTPGNSGGHGSGAMESYLGRISYNYAERYLFTASVRADGSSNFGANNRWGTFPSASVGWRIAKEPWWSLKAMNEAKLRFELGTTGNQGSGGVYETMQAGNTPWGTGFLLNAFANPDLKWESTMSYNGGIDLGFLQNRVQIAADYYVRKTDNLLMTAPLPAYMGTTGTGNIGAPQINFGSLRNTGWSLSITSTNIDTKNFKWASNFNISAFRPIITKLNSNSAQAFRTLPGAGNVMQIAKVGQAPWQFWGYIQDGYYTSEDDINNSAVPVDNTGTRYPINVDESKGIYIGDVKYKDINGDGIIDTKDQTVIGNPWPKFTGGFTNTFTYKDFDLNVLLTYSYGNDILNYQQWLAAQPHNFWVSQNVLQAVTNYAQVGTDANGNAYLTNPNAFIPRLGMNGDVNGNWNRITNRWVEDGSYLRLKNVSLTYTIPKRIIAKQNFLKNVRLSISAQNLLTWTKYKGYDPEVGAFVGSGVYGVGNQTIGVDYNHYPLTPMYSFSINVNL